MKKVLFVATVAKQHIMTFHLPYLKLFQENGWETAVAAYNDYDDPKECCIPYCDRFFDVCFDRSPLSKKNREAYRQLQRILTEEHYDLIHCHTPIAGFLTRLAARKTRKQGTRVLYTAHGFHFYSGAPMKNWLLYYPAERLASRWTDTLLTINEEDYKRAKRMHAKQALYVPGVGIDLSRFTPSAEPEREYLKQTFGITDELVLMSVGELNPNKNHQAIVRALAGLDVPFRYLICGQGQEKEHLEALAEQLGIAKQVIVTGYRKDIRELLRGADIFCFPSVREGLSLALMEAVASGVPCVVSDARGNSDLVKDGVNGFLCKAMDTDGYAAAIRKLSEDCELRRKMRESSREIIAPYGLDRVTECMRRIYFGG